MKNNGYIQIQAKDEETAEISVFGDIGGWWGEVTLENFKKDFDALKDKKQINVLVNSYGGDVFEGIAIYNVIARERAKVHVEIMGIAAWQIGLMVITSI